MPISLGTSLGPVLGVEVDADVGVLGIDVLGEVSVIRGVIGEVSGVVG